MGALRLAALLWFWGALFLAFLSLAIVGLGRFGWQHFRHELRRRKSL